MRFIDEAEIVLTSGHGGRGASSFRREKYVPRGGPDGGDGGDGGAIILVADNSMGSLMDFRQRREIRAENGHPGMGSNKHGKRGESVRVRLPVGTVVKHYDTGEVLADLVTAGEEVLLLEGGQGGRGNARFATSTNRVPTYYQPGLPGESVKVRLELKLLADVGLLGFPNAGKSTLISRISAARPKIADYPFTTLVPNLGVVQWADEKTFVVADIPGLIEGASQGAGLGIKFLKHVERNRLLLHLVDPADGEDPVVKYMTLRREVESFDSKLGSRPEIVVLTKLDVTEVREGLDELIKRFEDEAGVTPRAISAVTGEGLKELVAHTGHTVERLRAEAADDDYHDEFDEDGDE